MELPWLSAAGCQLIYRTWASPCSGDSSVFPLGFPHPTSGPIYRIGNGVAVCSEFQVRKVPLPILVCLLVCPVSLWMSDNKVEIFCYEKELWIFCLTTVKRIPRHGLDNLKTDCLS